MSGAQFSSLPHFDQLKMFLASKKIPTRQPHRGLPFRPMTSDLVDFININLGLAALYVQKLTPSISESAIDLLAVSGLLHFPPTEGGPLCYLARLGQDKVKRRFAESCSVMPTAVMSVVETYSGVLDKDVISRLFVKTEVTGQSSEYQSQREMSLLLSSSELKAVGQTRGVENREVFLLPVPFLAVILFAGLLLVTVSVCIVYKTLL